MGGPDALGFIERQSLDPFESCPQVEISIFAELAVRRIASFHRARQHEVQDRLPELVHIRFFAWSADKHGC